MRAKKSKIVWYIECKGNCIKPCEDIFEHYFKTKKETYKFVDECKRRKHGYVCDANYFKRVGD